VIERESKFSLFTDRLWWSSFRTCLMRRMVIERCEGRGRIRNNCNGKGANRYVALPSRSCRYGWEIPLFLRMTRNGTHYRLVKANRTSIDSLTPFNCDLIFACSKPITMKVRLPCTLWYVRAFTR
jgi:hypothetical protein